MTINTPTNRKIASLAATGAAFAVAATVLRHSKWKYPLYAAAGLGTAKYLADLGQRPTPESDRPAAPELCRSETINGIVMHWEEHGVAAANDIPVVMVHGLPTNPRVWRYVIPDLVKAGVRCLAWEQVGFGRSMEQGLDQDLSIPRQAEHLLAWLKHLGISKAILVGHDYGGGVVQRLLVDHPEVAAGVVLTDSVAFKNWPVPAVRAAQAAGSTLRFLPPALLKPVLFAAVANLHLTRSIEGESFETYWSPYNRRIGPHALAHQLKHFRNEDTKAAGEDLEAKKLALPARVVWGEKDPLGLYSAKRLAKALGTTLTVIEGGRHFTIEDQPEIVVDAIQAVLEEAKLIRDNG